MERTDRERSRSGSGESEFLVYDVVFPQRNDEENTEEGRGECQRYEPANVCFGELGQEIQAIHGRNS